LISLTRSPSGVRAADSRAISTASRVTGPAPAFPTDIPAPLINEEGLVEPDKGTFSLEPFLHADGKLITWADAKRSVRLEPDGLAIPTTQWKLPGFTLETTAFATGHGADAVLFVRYRVRNAGRNALRARLFVALRPYQVNPPWQAWQGLGGLSAIKEITWTHGAVRVNRDRWVVPLSKPAAFGAAAFEQGVISDHLAQGRVPGQTTCAMIWASPPERCVLI